MCTANDDLQSNLQKAVKLIEAAKENDSDIAILPEFFNSKNGIEQRESIPNGLTSQALSDCAKTNSIFIVAGSIAESDGDKTYNTSAVWNRNGKLVAKHRKIHLFDVDFKGELTMKESNSITAGDNYTIFNIDEYKIGLGICYDARFAELGSIYEKEGCSLLIYPSFYSMKTGSLHWTLVMRSRALDNQIYVAGVNRARDENAEMKSFAYSLFVNPLGQIETEAGVGEEILYGYVDLKKIKDIRHSLPTLNQKRRDLYNVTYKNLNANH